MGSHGDPHKWYMPGWRIEQRYSPGVLIGNWGEDRYKFQKGRCAHNSTHRIDFKQYGSHRPDVVIRRKAKFRNDGLGKELLFSHHGNRYSNNMISWYDEHYNKREQEEVNKLPDLRHWDSHRLAWVPEKTDYPLQGDPTKFGLYAKLQQKWDNQVEEEAVGDDVTTTYSRSYSSLPREAMVRERYAIPRAHSTSLHRYNATNKDLHLRNMPNLQAPESIPIINHCRSAPVAVRR